MKRVRRTFRVSLFSLLVLTVFIGMSLLSAQAQLKIPSADSISKKYGASKTSLPTYKSPSGTPESADSTSASGQEAEPSQPTEIIIQNGRLVGGAGAAGIIIQNGQVFDNSGSKGIIIQTGRALESPEGVGIIIQGGRTAKTGEGVGIIIQTGRIVKTSQGTNIIITSGRVIKSSGGANIIIEGGRTVSSQ